MPSPAIDPEDAWMHRVGGVSALVLGIAYVITIGLYASVGAPPNAEGGEAWLAYGAGKTTAWWAILALSVLTDVLFVPVVFSLYLALRGVGRGAMALAVAFVLLFVVLDLAVTWPNYAALISLSDGHGASTGAPRAADVAAATYASAVLGSRLFAVYAILVPSMGILVASLVMLHGTLGRIAAYVGVLTGILGIVSVVGPLFWNPLGDAVILTSLFTIAWVLLVGYRLRRLGQPTGPPSTFP